MTSTLGDDVTGGEVGGGVSVARSKKGFKLHPLTFALRAAFVDAFMRQYNPFPLTSVIS